MQFSAILHTLIALATLGIGITASPVLDATEEPEPPAANPAGYLVSHDQMMHWLATTDADLIFVGEPINPLASRSAQDTTVVYCSSRTHMVCGGRCMVYAGGAACLNAPGTECIQATNNVGFCDRAACKVNCDQLSTCRVPLDNGFCATPNTRSIIVSTL